MLVVSAVKEDAEEGWLCVRWSCGFCWKSERDDFHDLNRLMRDSQNYVFMMNLNTSANAIMLPGVI